MAATATAVHSPAAIKRAKQAAVTALAAATEAQPIPNSGGLTLCPEMRLWRATETLAATDTSDKRYTTIALATGKLADRIQALGDAARAAIAEYQRLCKAAGRQPETIQAPRCTCDGHRMLAAMEDTRRAALWLLWPMEQADERYPALAVLRKAGKHEYLNGKLDALADAQIAYTDACQRLGTEPQWGWILR